MSEDKNQGNEPVDGGRGDRPDQVLGGRPKPRRLQLNPINIPTANIPPQPPIPQVAVAAAAQSNTTVVVSQQPTNPSTPLPPETPNVNAPEMMVPGSMNGYEYALAKQQLDFEQASMSENWVKSYWRAGAAWLYMFICFMDFVVFPLIHIFSPAIGTLLGVPTIPYTPWTSLTLSNGGLIHMSFGAILGVAVWSRTQQHRPQ